MNNKKIYVACKENGDFIEEVKSIAEGNKLIKKYEEIDKKEGVFEDNFYNLVDENHMSI